MSSPSMKSHGEAEGPEEWEPGLAFLRPRFGEERFPWPQVVGYALSIVLTLVALWLVVRHALAPALLLAVVLVLAGGQAALQLGVFMHPRESRGTPWQIIPLALALGIALGMVVCSIWIMAFKWGVS